MSFLFSTRFRLKLGKEILDILDVRRAETGDPYLDKGVEAYVVQQELRNLETRCEEEKNVE